MWIADKINVFCILGISVNRMNKIEEQLDKYNIKYESMCNDAGESMPLGGHDVGLNVWVQDGILYFYMAESGAFDEQGNMVKVGRFKVCMNPNPFKDYCTQELRLITGDVEIIGKSGNNTTVILLWVDTKYGTLHVDIQSDIKTEAMVCYENWRIDNNGYPNPDEIAYKNGNLVFMHLNRGKMHFHMHVKEEGLESIADKLPDVQKNLVFGGMIDGDDMHYEGWEMSEYAQLKCVSHKLKMCGEKMNFRVTPFISYSGDAYIFENELRKKAENSRNEEMLKADSISWWKAVWERSYIFVNAKNSDADSDIWQMGRNYQLFRYMLACNAYGTYPTKFNGGLFTIDPSIWGARFGASTPDERDWGGIVFTAQNQRLVYWPMIKSGDTEWMKPQFEFYFRILGGAKARTEFFFGEKNAACIPEQVDANGLSAYYGLYGLDYPIHVRYHYVTSVEFGYMMLEYLDYVQSEDTTPYIEFIDTILNFYNQKYIKLDDNGKRIIFPSTAQETYHKAGIVDVWGEEGRYAANYNENETAGTNPADLIYALRAIITKLIDKGYGSEEQQKKWMKFKNELPPIPLETKKGHLVIAPLEEPKKYVKTNCEFPQLYCAYPYHEIGIGSDNDEDLQLARDTYFYGWDEEDQLMNKSWMYVGLLAARLGLTDEAVKYQKDKLRDSGRRFPTFWGPGFDYTPDHNHGGCGMIGLQEMVLQNFGGKIYILPAWPKDVDVEYKLWLGDNSYIEVSYVDGKLKYHLSDDSLSNSVVLCK